MLFVAWSIGYLPGTLLDGVLLDRSGPRRTLLLATLLMLGGMTALLLSISFQVAPLPVLTIYAGIAGMGGGIIDASTNGLISGIYTENRGVALNLFTLLYPLSSTLISFIASGLFVLFHDDPRPPVLVTIGVVAIAMLSIFFLPRPFSTGAATPQERVSSLPQLVQRVTALLPVLFPVIIAMLLTTGFTATIRTWTPAYLHVRYGQSPATHLS